MKKHQISTSVSKRTRRQADALIAKAGFATMSELLTVAIQKLYDAEMPSDADCLRRGDSDVECASCGKIIDPKSSWISGIYGEAFCAECQP